MSGKKYSGERGVISLTSWKARIGTVSKTIFSLLKNCPEFHIVLVLSEEEFPKKEAELPENLMLFVKNNLIEILWIYKNYRSLKKILFTMDKYRDVPVISADDDLIYKYNYAKELYDNLIANNCNVISPARKNMVTSCGGACCYSKYCFGDIALKLLNDKIIEINEDDMYYQWLIDKLKLKQIKMIVNAFPFKEHTNKHSLTESRKKVSAQERKKKYYEIFDKIYEKYNN